MNASVEATKRVLSDQRTTSRIADPRGSNRCADIEKDNGGMRHQEGPALWGADHPSASGDDRRGGHCQFFAKCLELK